MQWILPPSSAQSRDLCRATKLNRLTREDNQFAGKTYIYNYSSLGNLSSVQEGSFTLSGTPTDLAVVKSYSYGNSEWQDLLTSFNSTSITYDAIGNPTAIGSAALTWQGRTLTQYVDGSDTYAYSYDMSGHRISKTVNGTKTEYFYDGDVLVAQKTGDTNITFMLDAQGSAYGFYYGNSPYFYIKNIQGDVVAVTDFAGRIIGTYAYDAWGNLIESASDLTDEVAAMNPLRYRGYYYDAETGYYFLNSRYYSAEVGRFLNADGYISTGNGIMGYNMFAYCLNNPIMYIDYSGSFAVKNDNHDSVADVTAGLSPEYVKYVTTAATGQSSIKGNSSLISSTSSHDMNHRPNSGDPGSTFEAPNGDRRTYGPDRKPQQDYDHNDHGNPNDHPHDENGGHYHDWDWSKDKPRSAPYVISWEPIVGSALVVGCAIGLVYVVGNNAAGVGIIDDALIVPFVGGIERGLALLGGA